MRQKETACEEAKNNYWLTVEHTNRVQRQHYETDMPAIFAVSVLCGRKGTILYVPLDGCFTEVDCNVLVLC